MVLRASQRICAVGHKLFCNPAFAKWADSFLITLRLPSGRILFL